MAANNGSPKLALHAYMSEGSHKAWAAFSDENGVSISALLESLGRELATEMAALDPEQVRPAWVRHARRVDAERRKRGPR
jgi:hypothetical protein